MTLRKTFITLGALLAFALSIYALYGPQIAKAAVSVFAPSTCYTAAATTTLSYIAPGTSTTTMTGCNLGLEGAGSASLLVQFTASSTSSVLLGQLEYSQDGIDWYANNQDMYAAGAVAIATPSNSFTWTFASSTISGAAPAATNNLATKIIKINVPTRYVRAVFSMTGTNGAVWAQILPRQPIN